MSKKKGLSLEEKRKRMLDLFYERKDVFQLKELEKIAPKEKGIIMQSVKEVVQSLADDGYVDSDKIGTSVYFWAFPSKASQVRKRKIEELSEQLSSTEKKQKTAQDEISKIKKSRKNQNEEKLLEAIDQIAVLKTKVEKLKEGVNRYQDSDPEVIARERKEIEVARDAANRWTDNIFAVRAWLKKKFAMEEAAVNKQFQIPEELDYVE